MKFHTINFLLISISILINSTYAGVTVSGTKFFFNKDSKRINIKTMNDDQAEYLVKIEVKGDNKFIVSPPLMLLKKNQSNITTIIPQGIHYDQDQLFDLVVTTIPKVEKTFNNAIHLALRSNFKLIYRHEPLKEDLNLYLSLKKLKGNLISNHSKSYITFYIACDQEMNEKKTRFNILPKEEISIPYCKNDTWATIVRDDNSIGPVVKLSSEI